MDKSKWDTSDWWDWMLDQSDDSVVAELKIQYDEITALRNLVQEMGELLDRIDHTDWHSKEPGDNRDKFCEICGVIPGHAGNCIAVVSKEIINRSEVRKIMEAK